MSSDDGTGSVRVVGTAHVSAASVEEVESVIDEERPDIVAVELDDGRYRQLRGDAPEDLDAGDLLKGNTVYQFLAYWMLSYVQARLGDRFDIEPGADMKAAIDTAEGLGIDVALVDRDIQVTIQRFWSRLSFSREAQTRRQPRRRPRRFPGDRDGRRPPVSRSSSRFSPARSPARSSFPKRSGPGFSSGSPTPSSSRSVSAS